MKLSYMLLMGAFLFGKKTELEEEDEFILRKILAAVHDGGVEAVDITSEEIRLFGAQRVKSILQEYKLEVGCIICFSNFSQPDSLAAFASGKLAVDGAVALECKTVMLVPVAQDVTASKKEQQRAMVKQFGAVVNYAEKAGVTCVIEDDPHLEVPMCSTEELDYLFDQVSHLQMVYDAGNMLIAKEDPMVYYKHFASRVRHVHLKDLRIAQENERADIAIDGTRYAGTAHGTGIIDLQAIISALSANGYDGYLTVESSMSQGEDFAACVKRDYSYCAMSLARAGVGVQLFGLKNELSEGWKDTLQELKDGGITSIEPCIIFSKAPAFQKIAAGMQQHQEASNASGASSNYMGSMWMQDIAEMKMDYMHELGFRTKSCHVMLANYIPGILVSGVDEMILFAKTYHITQYVISYSFKNREEVDKNIQDLNTVAKLLAEQNIMLCYHPHGVDFTVEGGNTLMDYMLDIAVEELKIQLDVGWAQVGGCDVITFIKKYGKRIVSLHLKDFVEDYGKNEGDAKFVAIGEGIIRSKEYIDAYLKNGEISADCIILDQDGSAGSMLEDILLGTKNVKKMLEV